MVDPEGLSWGLEGLRGGSVGFGGGAGRFDGGVDGQWDVRFEIRVMGFWM